MLPTKPPQHTRPKPLQHRQALRETLESGVTVVADRYSYSGVAFSAAKGLDRGWCEAQETGLPAPDAVLYLALSLDEAATRGGFGEERYETRDLQEKVCAWSVWVVTKCEGRSQPCQHGLVTLGACAV